MAVKMGAPKTGRGRVTCRWYYSILRWLSHRPYAIMVMCAMARDNHFVNVCGVGYGKKWGLLLCSYPRKYNV